MAKANAQAPARKNPARDLVESIQDVIDLLWVAGLATEKCVGRLVAARNEYVRYRLRKKPAEIKPRHDQLSMREFAAS